MQKFKAVLRAGLLYAFAVVLIGSYPMIAMAETSPTTPAPTAPAPEKTYTFNPDTQRWDSNEWQYDPASGKYQAPPAPAPAPTSSSTTETTTPATESTTATTTTPSGQATTTTETGANGSSNTATTSTSGSSDTEANTNNKIENNLDSDAQSGNALVNKNVTAGDATSGNATAETTVINTVHSTVSGDTTGVAHFVSDIYGNVYGDITLSPTIDAATSQQAAASNSKVKVNNDTDITNNIDLAATSGSAGVTNNTSAGSATTGDANTVANVLNLINSIIAANKSFVGTINIHGNLDGDILISPDFIPQLIATNNFTDPTSGSLKADLNDSSSIINNIALNAQSGAANVTHNTSAGNATTGNADTNLTVLNLTGKEVVARNSLLVFVNVLGEWIGMIVDAPLGTTAAAIGNGVTTNASLAGSQVADVNNNSTITNNLNLNSQSGDATVANNTRAGDATSGDATASANVLNMSTSSFSLTDWFGVLFINVFGKWMGSFGINTANGDVIQLEGAALTPLAPPAPSSPKMQFGFVPRNSDYSRISSTPLSMNQDNSSGGSSEEMKQVPPAVLAAIAKATPAKEQATTLTPRMSPRENPFAIVMMVGGFLTAAVGATVELIRRRHITGLA